MLMITGLGSAKDLVAGRKGAFYNTLQELHQYFERIDIIAPRITNLFGNVYIYKSGWPLIFHPFWFLKKGFEIYREQKFDLMTVHDFPPFYNGIGTRLLWQKIKVPYVLEFHHISGYPKAANFKEKIYANEFVWKLYWRIFGLKAKVVRVVNQKQTPEFLKKVGVSENKIVYIPSLYIDLDVFRPMGLEKEYDLIFVGRLEPNKGVDLFLNAARILKIQSANRRTKFKILIIGDGPLSAGLKFKVKSLKLEDDVIFYGRAKDSREIAELMNKSKILVMPSYNEGGPRVVLEAMACGVPVLATNVGLMPDFEDKSAVKIIDWNAEDIAKKARELLENESERNRLSRVGLEVARQFEKKEMVKNYADALKKLLN